MLKKKANITKYGKVCHLSYLNSATVSSISYRTSKNQESILYSANFTESMTENSLTLLNHLIRVDRLYAALAYKGKCTGLHFIVACKVVPGKQPAFVSIKRDQIPKGRFSVRNRNKICTVLYEL